jgi:hypothetical protein
VVVDLGGVLPTVLVQGLLRGVMVPRSDVVLTVLLAFELLKAFDLFCVFVNRLLVSLMLVYLVDLKILQVPWGVVYIDSNEPLLGTFADLLDLW